jgi:hypothetical protein
MIASASTAAAATHTTLLGVSTLLLLYCTQAPLEHDFPGAVSPVTITAKETSRVYCFTVAQFEAVAGPIRDVFSQAILGRPSVLKPMSFITDTAIVKPQVSTDQLLSMYIIACS